MSTPGSGARLALAGAVGIALALGTAARAQAPEHAERRVLLVNVLDEDGHRVEGLTAASFRGELRGRPVTVLSAAEDEGPRNVAVLVDVSGSSARTGDASWRAAEWLVERLTPKHRVVLLTVAEKVTKHSELTNDRQVLQEALRDARARPAWGPSALGDGVVQVCRGFRDGGPGSVVCLLTDGADTSSRLDRSAVEKALAATRVRVSVVRPDRPRADVPALFQDAERWTKAVTDATGGLIVRPGSRGKEGNVETLVASIVDTWRLEVAFPLPIDKPRPWKLEVAGPDGERLRGVRLVYPRIVAPGEP